MYSNTLSHSHSKHLLAAHQERQHRQRQLQERVRQEADRLAAILVQEFGAHTVYAVGPLTYDQFTKGMPLELAVEGMPFEEMSRALAHLKQICAFRVDMYDVRQLDSWTRETVGHKGIVLAKK